MKIQVTIANSYAECMSSALRNLQSYDLTEDPMSLQRAILDCGTVIELGLKMIAETSYDKDIYKDNTKTKTKPFYDILHGILKSSEHEQHSMSYQSHNLDVSWPIREVQDILEQVRNVRNMVVHNSGTFDDDEMRKNLITVIAFFNHRVPYDLRLHEVLCDRELKHFYNQLIKNDFPHEYFGLSLGSKENHMGSQDLTIEFENCKYCGNFDTLMFSVMECLIQCCPLCSSFMPLYKCQRCSDYIDMDDHDILEIDANENAYICGYCYRDYMS